MSNLIRKLLAGLSPAPEGPTIALLSDFGWRDAYAGTVKGIIAGINPQARIIDITHEVGTQDIREGAFALWSSFRFFPDKTIFLAVVDPGVGTSRAILMVETGEYTFLAPDNGILDLVVSEAGSHRAYAFRTDESEGKWKRFVRRDISQTFHGRDIFAPLAAHLSLGVTPEQIGEARPQLVPVIGFFDPVSGMGRPCVLHIDRFGNVVTNVRPRPKEESLFGLTVGRRRITGWVSTYEEAPASTPRLILGSGGLVEVIVRNGSAAKVLGAGLSETITLIRM